MKRTMIWFLILMMAVVLGACQREESAGAEQAESAAASVEEAAVDTMDSAAEAADEAVEAADEAVDAASEMAADAYDAATEQVDEAMDAASEAVDEVVDDASDALGADSTPGCEPEHNGKRQKKRDTDVNEVKKLQRVWRGLRHHHTPVDKLVGGDHEPREQ